MARPLHARPRPGHCAAGVNAAVSLPCPVQLAACSAGGHSQRTNHMKTGTDTKVGMFSKKVTPGKEVGEVGVPGRASKARIGFPRARASLHREMLPQTLRSALSRPAARTPLGRPGRPAWPPAPDAVLRLRAASPRPPSALSLCQPPSRADETGGSHLLPMEH